MRVLIIGGLGYLGPIIAEQLKISLVIEKITALDTHWYIDNRLKNNEIFDDIIFKDKRNITINDLNKFNIVVDLAAVSNDPMGKDFASATIDINEISTTNIAQKSKIAGVKKFIFASSCSIYGSAGDTPRKENDLKEPLTEYAISKWNAEQSLSKIADSNFSIIALRFATACGWSPNFRADLVLNDFVVTALMDKKIIVLSDGTPWRPLIHTRDIGKAVAWSCQTEIKGYDAYNVGSNNWTLTIKELASCVSKIMKVPIVISNKPSSDKRSYRVCFDKFEDKAKGWLPTEDLKTTIEELKVKLMPFKERFKDFREGDLIRLNVLKKLVKNNKLTQELRVFED